MYVVLASLWALCVCVCVLSESVYPRISISQVIFTNDIEEETLGGNSLSALFTHLLHHSTDDRLCLGVL